MNTSNSAWLLPLAAVAAAAASPAYAAYLSPEQARSAMFPGATFIDAAQKLNSAQVDQVQKRSGQRVLSPQLRVWRVSTGGWFVIDQVIGKHEFITYAVGIDGGGAIKGVEILDYRESYGGEVGAAAWRAQFVGKRAAAPLKLGDDIRNISGATLSSKHIADGVRRLLATHAIVLAP